jgi:polysaccharide biosynthesis/export protein
MQIRCVAVAYFCLLTVGSCATPRVYDYSKEPDPRTSEYVVGVSDELRINVWREQELSVEAKVRPDGTITMPLVGDVKAAGLPPSAIRHDIVNRLAKFIKAENLQVTVAVTKVASYQFTISGNVDKPGMYSPTGFVTVLEAITMASGPNRYADLDGTVVLRKSAAGSRQIPINLSQLKTGQHLEQNIVVLAGDIIVVP